MLIFAVLGTLSALAPNPGTLLVLRALTGFGLGGALPLDFSPYAEYLPSRDRGRNPVLLESFWALGTVAAAGLVLLLVPTAGWRPLLACSALAAALVWWIRRQVAEASRVLAQVAEANRQSLPAGEPQPAAHGHEAGMGALWRRPYRAITAVLWLA